MSRLALWGAAFAAALVSPTDAQDAVVEGPKIRLGTPADTTNASPAAARTIAPPAGGGPSPARVAASYSGGFDDFGKAIDRSGNDILIAQDTEAWHFDAIAGWTNDGFIQISGLPATSVHDVAVEGDYALVAMKNGNDTNMLTYERVNGTWTYVTLEPNTQSNNLVELHDGIAIEADDSAITGDVVVSTHGMPNLFGQDLHFLPNRTLVSMDFGDGATESGFNSLVVVTESAGGLREVHLFHVDGLTLIHRGVIASTSLPIDYGADVAVDDGTIWVGAPGFDGIAPDGGIIEVFSDDGSLVTFAGSLASNNPNDLWGRALSASNGIALISEREADLVPGSSATGAVRVVRENGGFWTLTGEILHPFDFEFSNGDEFGYALANDGLQLAVGEPAFGVQFGKFWLFGLPGASMTNNNRSPPLAGAGPDPISGGFGTTFDGAPFLLEFGNIPANSVGQLVIGAAELGLPFKGGVLYPAPNTLIPVPTGPTGLLQLFGTWADLGSGLTIYFQFWVADATAPNGFAATPGFNIVDF